MSATKTPLSGAERKTLSSQLDRLDSILDRLAIGLQQAVAHAVQQGTAQAVREAVQATLTEVRNSADLRAALAPASSTAVTNNRHEVVTSTTDRPTSPLSRTWGRLLACLRQVPQACCRLFGSIAGCLPLLLAAWLVAPRYKRQLWAACGIGVAFSLAVYFAGPWLGLLLGWLGGFTLALIVQSRDTLRNLLTTPANSA
jgi:hypothetical protein